MTVKLSPARFVVPVAASLLGVWWVRRTIIPARPDDAATPHARPLAKGESRPSPDGAGMRIVVNPGSGPAWTDSPTEELRQGLPAADIHEMSEGDDLEKLLCDRDFDAIGAAGGDGTLAAAAAIAVERDVPLIAVPAGTLNHLARDLGLESAQDAVEAVRAGTAACIDLGTVGDRYFVNTLSLGGYSAVVDARERLEKRVGKWPALVIALARELPKMEPMRLRIDGRRTDVWLGWIGNCVYGPPGLAPAWRESLDDGLLDVRLVHGGPRYARTRFVLAALIGRLSALSVYSEQRVESLEVECLDGPPRLATDGETFDGPASFTVGKRRRALRVFLPAGG